jgi:hypothetical protein
MHAHSAKILPEARLHQRPGGSIERLARRLEHGMHDWRRRVGRVPNGGALERLAFLAAPLALAAA